MSHNGSKPSKKDQNIIFINICVFFGRFTPTVIYSHCESFLKYKYMYIFYFSRYAVLYWFIRMNLDISRK